MIIIRLSRFGRKKKPFYRIVVADSKFPRDGKFIEKIGFYDPKNKKTNINMEKVSKWIKNGANITNIVKFILSKNKIV